MSTPEYHFFHHPKDRLRLTVDEDRSYPTAIPSWASPLSHPDRFLSILDAKGEEIFMLERAEDIPGESGDALREEIRRRYLTARILVIEGAKVEFGATYWSVQTDRGPRDFVAQSLQENAQWLSDTHLLLVDIDGNRFEIPNVDDLDAKSRRFVDTIL